VLIASFPAGPWGTNCYVVAPAAGEECVIVDPGMGATDGVAEVVAQHGLRPAAVLVTHGHIDHMFCVAPVAGAYEATAYVHPDDRALLADPLAGLSPEMAGMLPGRYEFAEPDDVRELSDRQRLEIAGLVVEVDHAPGHTWGSVAFRMPYDGPEDVPEVMFSGDLLFAGSIGRTDLPGGDHPTMLRSLAAKVLPLADEIVVLPGHGSQTTIGRERATNPYLRGL
jgi:hydroxyacylglutathione hydrolase